MSISITWGLIARMDDILSAEPLMYCIRTNSHNFTQCAIEDLKTKHSVEGHGWIHGIAMCYDHYS